MKVLQKLWVIYLMAHPLFAQADTWLLKADRVFDGHELRMNQALLIDGATIKAIGPIQELQVQTDQVLDFGDATLLPGLIELHSHIQFQQVPEAVVLEHGITTARDLGGDLIDSNREAGRLRLLAAGPILTVADGYPLNIFAKGHDQHHHHLESDRDIAIALADVKEAEAMTLHLIAGGANVIKVALEPGGESGAPWASHSGANDWPMLSAEMLAAIVTTAHQQGKKVSAHLSEERGVQLALQAGVDEWAHMPCLPVDDALLRQAVNQHVTVISTLDTLSHCPGVMQNARRLAGFGATILYGAELAHPEIPWGFDNQELQLLMHVTGMSPIAALTTVTAKAGEHLGLAPLGQLVSQAPADIIAVRGNAVERLKSLEYPDWVMAGGQIIVNRFATSRSAESD